jgi:hypothetical protein
LSSGRIRRLSSQQAASFFFQPKAEEANAPGEDPGLHPVQDYQYLNTYVVQDQYPLPLLCEILQAPKLQTAQYFCYTTKEVFALGRAMWVESQQYFQPGDSELQQVNIYTNSSIAQPSFQHPYHVGVHCLVHSTLPFDQHHHPPTQLPSHYCAIVMTPDL